MPRLYEVLHGQFGRKDHEGNQSLIVPGDLFVPTPSELKSDAFRIRKTDQEVDWEAPQAQAALRSVNMKSPECAGFGPKGFAGFAEEVPETAGQHPSVAGPQIRRNRNTPNNAAPTA